jgi:hypothetical protein
MMEINETADQNRKVEIAIKRKFGAETRHASAVSTSLSLRADVTGVRRREKS